MKQSEYCTCVCKKIFVHVLGHYYFDKNYLPFNYFNNKLFTSYVCKLHTVYSMWTDTCTFWGNFSFNIVMYNV